MQTNANALQTLAEQSAFQKTGRYDEVLRLTKAYAETWPDAVRTFDFGRTAEGRPMVALVVTRTGALTAEAAKSRKIPVLLLQGGIHPGESDGKDAGFLALREILEKRAAAGVLERIVILFVPVLNVDGHERFGPWNRPNQVGPEEMGFRATARNLNLNRDYVKADAPEMQALLGLLEAWDPIVYGDLHVSNGADFEHDVSIQVEPIHLGDPVLHAAGKELRAQVMQKLAAQGSLPVDFYPDLVRKDDPAGGFAAYVYSPRFSTGYWGLRNRLTLLLEAHSWKDYPTRVRLTFNTITALAEATAEKGEEWLGWAREADANALKLGGTEVALDYGFVDRETQIDFRGYAYTREPSAVSGALATRYDPSKPEIWRVPLRDASDVTKKVVAPRGGYVIPAGWADEIGPRLNVHGIRFRRLSAAVERADVETFRATQVKFESAPFEGRMMATVTGQWRPEPRDVPEGSLIVPIAQTASRLAVAMLEPDAPDSLVSWGFFNAVFERKEYMDAYVAEQVGREMLATDPALAAEFARKLDQEPDFARDPAARLDFFYQRHPSWDERVNLIPVYRVWADSVGTTPA